MSYILESKEVSVVYPVKISIIVQKQLKAFQSFLLVIPFKSLQPNEVKEVISRLQAYKKYSFSKSIIQSMQEYISTIEKGNNYIQSFKHPRTEHLKKTFLQKEYKSIYQESLAVKKELENLMRIMETTSTSYQGTKSYVRSSMDILFSGGQRTGLFGTFDEDMLEKVKQVDLSKMVYSYIHPSYKSDGKLYVGEGTNEIEVMSYIILHMKDSPKPIRLDKVEYEVYRRITSPVYNKARDALQDYIFNNDKSKVETIKLLISQEDRQAMLSSLSGIKKVYRGLAIDSDTKEKDIISKEKKLKYVSTTPSKNIALRFAKQLGHLEDPSNARSSSGAIIEYDISNRDCIILSTAIWGEAYNEADILIDTSKATIMGITFEQFR